jgi:hypothetical protein
MQMATSKRVFRILYGADRIAQCRLKVTLSTKDGFKNGNRTVADDIQSGVVHKFGNIEAN